MSSYDDPRWYEQPEQQDNSTPIPRQPTYDESGPIPALQLPDHDTATRQRSYPYLYPSPQPSLETKRRPWRRFGQFVVLIALLLITSCTPIHSPSVANRKNILSLSSRPGQSSINIMLIARQ